MLVKGAPGKTVIIFVYVMHNQLLKKQPRLFICKRIEANLPIKHKAMLNTYIVICPNHIQCGQLSTESSQNSPHSSPVRGNTNVICDLTLIYILIQSTQCCMIYCVISHRSITAPRHGLLFWYNPMPLKYSNEPSKSRLAIDYFSYQKWGNINFQFSSCNR